MPGTDDVVTIEPPLPERAAHVIADTRDRGKLAVDAGEGHLRAAQENFPDGRSAQRVTRADVDPLASGFRGLLRIGGFHGERRSYSR